MSADNNDFGALHGFALLILTLPMACIFSCRSIDPAPRNGTYLFNRGLSVGLRSTKPADAIERTAAHHTSDPLVTHGPQVPMGFAGISMVGGGGSGGAGRYINPDQRVVSGYTRQDGRQVQSYVRTAANATTQDNLRNP